MSTVIASTNAIEHLRSLPPERRRLVSARIHTAGGVWAMVKATGGQAVIDELVEQFGTKVWSRGRWVVRRAQLKLPGIL